MWCCGMAWCDHFLVRSGVAEEAVRLLAGVPVIRRVAKRRSEDGQHKVLTCEAEGSPKPTVAWSVNGTSV